MKAITHSEKDDTYGLSNVTNPLLKKNEQLKTVGGRDISSEHY